MRVLEIVVEESKGKVPVLAGAGGYDTREVIHTAGEMARRGVSGFLSVTPYYNKPTQEGLYQHYKAFAGSTPLPIIVYNVPGRTGVNVEPSTLARLSQIPKHSPASRKRPATSRRCARSSAPCRRTSWSCRATMR
jgi:Dihydrodipicolinate synthase/N-acetylneuraminate lyase